MTVDLTVVILTYNESLHLERAIRSVQPFARRVVVIDSHSTDGTQALARSLGAEVYENRFTSHARQFGWGLEHGEIATGWIMRLDADEVIEADLAARIAAELPAMPQDVAGLTLDRKHVFMGRWIRHGGRYPVTLLRIWRRGQGRVEDRWMDEHVVVWGGRTAHLRGGFADVNLKDLSFFTAKHNDYATREAVQVLIERYHLTTAGNAFDSAAAPRQARLKRIVKTRVYARLPFPVSTLGYFLWRFIVQRGFLDGIEGLIYHVLQGFWYRFLVGAKTLEFDRDLRALPDAEARRARLAAISGLPVADVLPVSEATPR